MSVLLIVYLSLAFLLFVAGAVLVLCLPPFRGQSEPLWVQLLFVAFVALILPLLLGVVFGIFLPLLLPSGLLPRRPRLWLLVSVVYYPVLWWLGTTMLGLQSIVWGCLVLAGFLGCGWLGSSVPPSRRRRGPAPYAFPRQLPDGKYLVN
jgi:hypothetical protein